MHSSERALQLLRPLKLKLTLKETVSETVSETGTEAEFYCMHLLYTWHRVNNDVQHFKIGKPTPGQYNVWEKCFPSVTALVNQYRVESISHTDNVTLRCASLRYSLRRLAECFAPSVLLYSIAAVLVFVQ